MNGKRNIGTDKKAINEEIEKFNYLIKFKVGDEPLSVLNEKKIINNENVLNEANNIINKQINFLDNITKNK
jgi:hypothetical protein